MLKTGIFALAIIASASLCAKDSNGSFAVKGVGALNCNDFIGAAAKDTPELQQYAGYLAGYVSAYNELNPETFDLLPWQQLDTVMLLILQRCKQSPGSSVAGVVSQIARYFAENKVNLATDKIEVKGPELSVYLYPSVITQIKQALAKRGYETEDLWAAMAKYKQDKLLVGTHPFEQLILMKLLYGSD